MSVLDPVAKRALLSELLRRRDQRAAPIPLSSAQRRLWLLDELEPGAPTYNVSYAFGLHGTLDRHALEGALNTIVRRHDILRATIGRQDGEPVYRIDESRTVGLPCRELPPAELAGFLAREAEHRFDLASELPIRVELVRCAPGEHVLFVNLHHIATDGWSMGIFKRELRALYAAYRRGEGSPLPPLGATYADFAQAERAALTAATYDERLAFWTDLLRDPPAPLDIAARPASLAPDDVAGRVRTHRLSDTLHTLTRELGQRAGTTLFATLLAAFAVLLERYTGRCDFLIGTAVANRTRAEFEELIGFFVNTLPLRLRIDGEPTFAAWLGDVARLTLDAIERSDIPFQAVVEATNPARASTQTPLVNVMFVVQNAPDEPLELDELRVEPISLERVHAKFDLTFEARPLPSGELELTVEYRTALFDAPVIDALLASFDRLMREIVADPERPIGTLPVGDALGPRALPSAGASACGERIERSFEAVVAGTPDAVAIVDGSHTLTYAQLNTQANRLAHYLRANGYGDGARVGLCLERGAAAIVALLAIVKAGGVYVPLDPSYPARRIGELLRAAGATLLLTDERARPSLTDTAIAMLALDADAARFAAFPSANLERRDAEAATDPAYLIATSGSTGTPKAVLVAHAGIDRLARDPGYVRLGPDVTIAAASTLAFDAATFEIWAPLLTGGRIVIVPTSTLLVPGALAEHIERTGITTMFVTTALVREIVATAPRTFDRLAHLLVGGELLTAGAVQRLFDGGGPARVSNMYGPTETTTFATAYPLEPAAVAPLPAHAGIPIGRPIAATTAHVLDAHRQPVPLGATGQLYLGGPGVALGYLDDPALTGASFIPDPSSSGPGARLYATGDRVRERANGDLEFIGRLDAQIKRRGFRIEPGEIEVALCGCSGVIDAAVLAHGTGADAIRLVAYVSGSDPQTVPAAIMRQLRACLPSFMLPDAIVVRPSLPRNRSGKIDRAALPALDSAAAIESVDATPPRTDVQAALRRVWGAVLGTTPSDVGANFFELGGHSLLALRLLTEIEATFGVRLPTATLFADPTIEGLARALEAGPTTLAGPPIVTYNAGGMRAPLFFFHGNFSSSGFYCRAIADALGPDRPLHAMRPHGSGGEPLPATIEAMAVEHLAQIRALVPHGPYVIGGYCAGGFVAFEIAQRLRAAGERVAGLVLVDVPNAPRMLRMIAGGIDRVGAIVGLEPTKRRRLTGMLARLPHHLSRFADSPAKLAFIRERVTRPLRGRTATTSAPLAALADWRRRAEAYVPRAYDGTVTLLLTRPAPGSPVGDRGGWRTNAPRVICRDIPGTHMSCITEFLDDTARAIATALEPEVE